MVAFVPAAPRRPARGAPATLGVACRCRRPPSAAAAARARSSKRVAVSASASAEGDDVFRPTLDDVERLSRGQAAKERGTGSRAVPHRLNAEEREQYELAKRRRFLAVRGTAYRRERKGAPLVNTFRQWCDALAIPSVRVQKGNPLDDVLVDLSTLRTPSLKEAVERCDRVAAATVEGAEAGELVSVEVDDALLGDEDVGAEESQPAAMAEFDAGEDVLRLPIWRLAPQLVRFRAARSESKRLAEALVSHFLGNDPSHKQ